MCVEEEKYMTSPDKFGDVPPENPNIDEPLVEDPFDPESDTKLTQFINKCKDLGRVAVNEHGKWAYIHRKLIS